MEQYKVHNGARDPETRTQRAQNAQHRGLKLFIPIGQQRVLRGRPVVVTEQQIGEHIKEMQALQDAGLIYVTTMDERVVDLYTGERAPMPAEPLAPRPPLDSAANDATGGQELLGMFSQEPPPPSNFEMPVSAPLAAFADPVVKAVEEAPGETPKVELHVTTEVPVPETEVETTLEEDLEDAKAQQEEPESSSMPDLAKAPQPTSKKKGR